MDTLEKKIEKALEEKKLASRGDHLLVGLSGGPDSMALMRALESLQKRWQWTLYGVHINHQLRGSAAQADQAFVRAYCEKKGISLLVEEKDCPR